MLKRTYFLVLFGVLIFVFLFRRESIWQAGICQNLPLMLTQNTLPANLCTNFINEQWIWLQGTNHWKSGQYELAFSVWESAPNYVATMLVSNVELQDATNFQELQMLKDALLLAPNEMASTVSALLLIEEDIQGAYKVLDEVHRQIPNNPVIKSTLAVAVVLTNTDVYDSLALFDEALSEDPYNIAVLRNGLRLMMIHPEFGEERTRYLAEVSEEQLPQDFGFTLGVANAFLKLEYLGKAFHYNNEALKMNPTFALVNLQQAELSQKLNFELDAYKPWLEVAIAKRIQNASYYQRLIFVLVEAEMDQQAYQLYCEGLSIGYSSKTLKPEQGFSKEYIFKKCR